MSETRPLRIVVIGGGFTGAVFVIHAIRASSSRKLAITVVEPAAELAKGTAYGTDDPVHRINVPSDRMALSKDDPNEATRWFFAKGILPDGSSDDGQGQFYVSRQSYGAFALDTLKNAVDSAQDRVTFRHVRAHATGLERDNEGWKVETDSCAPIGADLVALCFGHAAPGAPCPITPDVADSPKFVPDPWAARALSKIAPSDSVLIVGTGLTMADVVTSLTTSGHQGHVTAVSRRGLLPRGHGLFLMDVDLFGDEPPPRTALGLLRHMRRRIREGANELGWQPFVDSLRFHLPDVWNGLPAEEQRRVVRRLPPFWDVHRFRIAPQVSDVLGTARVAGRLGIEKAGLTALSYQQGRYAATLQQPGGQTEQRFFDAVVLCTGPEKNLERNPLIAGLLAEGTAQLDKVRLGLAVDRSSRVVDSVGRRVPGLIALGPMTRGSFGEMTGAPDIAKHIERIVGPVLDDVSA